MFRKDPFSKTCKLEGRCCATEGCYLWMFSSWRGLGELLMISWNDADKATVRDGGQYQ
jgi:hypothetical protein